jgi:hypothetical protein
MTYLYDLVYCWHLNLFVGEDQRHPGDELGECCLPCIAYCYDARYRAPERSWFPRPGCPQKLVYCLDGEKWIDYHPNAAEAELGAP